MSEEKKDNLRKFSPNELEDIIAKAISQAVGREYGVEIQSIDFDERKLGDYNYHDSCKINLKLRHIKYPSTSKRVIGKRPD